MLRTLVLLPDAVASCSGRRHAQLAPPFVQAQRDRLARKQAASPWSSQAKLQGSCSSAAARLRGVCRDRDDEQSGPTQQLGNGQQQQGDDTEWVIVNFYHLCDLPEPKQFVEAQRAWVEAEGLNITGRIYFSSQGVNAQFGGPREDALAYTNQLQEHPLFRGLYFSVWPATGQMFPKLRLKYKPNLISLAGGMEGLPVTKPEARATKLNPAGWKDMISQAEQRKVVVLDVRNGYEWDAGHFAGAQRPAEEVFSETPVGESQADIPEPLRGADPNTPVMMYCTGGIRCDVYSTFLRTKGFNNLYTLEGGIQNYFREKGSDFWNGSLYVFDGRMAISSNLSGADPGQLPAAVPCQVCGAPEAQLPHMNCANIDCNELFIACSSCKTRFSGCCCQECMSAPRLLRPAKVDGGNYGQWGNYADSTGLGEVRAIARSEGHLQRKARRREVIRTKREAIRARQLEERAQRKALMRRVMAEQEAKEQGASPPSSSTPAAGRPSAAHAAS